MSNMKYIVLMQFIPSNDQIWGVARLTPEDPIHVYSTQEAAQAKADELQAADPTDRLYKVEEYNEETTY
jgi:hypothetical protein